MEFTIEKTKNTLIVDEKEYNGYAFIDEMNKCFIIVYGESKRDLLKNIL